LRGSGPSVELLDPVGPQDTAPSFFRWRRDPQAAAYRFELVDSEAVPVLSSVVTDTFWTPKGSAVEVPVSGSWHITPLDELMMDLGPSSTASYRTRP
jgi:hypothetical protein